MERFVELWGAASIVAGMVAGWALLALLAVWLLWQATLHTFALFGCWGRKVIWFAFRSRCTCDASDPVKYGWRNWKPKRLTDRGKGIF